MGSAAKRILLHKQDEAIDLSGHGKPDNLNGDMSIDRGYSSEIAALIEHLRLTDFILVGHSMGGGAAMCYCPDAQSILPKAPVPVDTSPVLELSKLAPGFAREAIEDGLSLFKNQSYEDYTESHGLKELENRIRRANPGVLQHDLSVCNRFNIADRVKDIRIPTLVLVGEHDNITPPVVAEALKNELPQADIAIAREAHHEPMIEPPEEFNRLLRKFIAWIEGKH